MEKVQEPEEEKKSDITNLLVLRYGDYLFIFDTETSVDLYHNLKVGFFAIFYKENVLIEYGFFYVPERCSHDELREIMKFCAEHAIKLYTLQKFIRLFYKYTLFKKALCINFNAPFDLARISLGYSFAKGEKFHGGFSLQLTHHGGYPRIKVKADGSKFAMIEFAASPIVYRQGGYRGRFLDLHTLSRALSGGKNLSLLRAGKHFGAKDLKGKAKEHGKIDEPYLRYLIQDVKATFSLYQALLQEYKKYNLSLPPEKIYSEASLGKHLLHILGFTHFDEQTASIPSEIKGYAMAAFYGGRSEVKYRMIPTKCTVLDVTSMYPTANILLGLDRFLRAEKIEVAEDTENVQKFLDTTALCDLQKPETYKQMCVICEIVPDEDIVPVKGRFSQKEQHDTIGLCDTVSDVPLYYCLPHLIGSKLLTGKAPKIKRAWRFIPLGIKKELQTHDVLGISLEAEKDNIFQKLVVEKERLGRERIADEEDVREQRLNKKRKMPVKIMSNSTGYGIYCEVNPEHKSSKIKVYSDTQFIVNKLRFEKPGPFFHPIMGPLIPSVSWLFLAIIEHILEKKGLFHMFCDTDSMAVPVEAAQEIQDFLQPLNLYGSEVKLLKKEYEDVWFFGISSKRYFLYEEGEDGQIKILKSSAHGLGHLMDPFGKKDEFWHKMVWKDILRLHKSELKPDHFKKKYWLLGAVSKLTINNYELWKQVKILNENRQYHEQIKPFGFCCTTLTNTTEEGKPVKPIAPFHKNPQEVIRRPFIDATTGQLLCGKKYWRRLDEVLDEYINHKDPSFEGENGLLKRKKIHVERTIVCGKEVKNLENAPFKKDVPNLYYDPKKVNQFILDPIPKDVRDKIGIKHRSEVKYLRDQIKQGKELNPNNPIMKKILEYLFS